MKAILCPQCSAAPEDISIKEKIAQIYQGKSKRAKMFRILYAIILLIIICTVLSLRRL
jgi:predicted nucleic acid-binding Zn ribbon protein